MSSQFAPIGGADAPSVGCANAKLRHELGWVPAFPTYSSGFA
jgi:hypothetical protein